MGGSGGMEIGHHDLPELTTDYAFTGESVRIECSKKTNETPALAENAVDTITTAPVWWRAFARYRDSRSALIWLLWVNRGATV